MPRPVFDEQSHTYRHPKTGSILPGVTSVLGEFVYIDALDLYVALDGHTIPGEIMRNAADLGTAVHKALQYALTVGPDGFVYPDEIAPMVQQIDAWRQDYQPEILAVEMPLYSERYLFAGTLDLICRIGGGLCLVDAKTGQGLLTGPQTAAYESLYREDTGYKGTMARYKLRLPKDGGKYQFILQPDATNDWNYFKARMFCSNYLKGFKK
jgi:hypothetical protein